MPSWIKISIGIIGFFGIIIGYVLQVSHLSGYLELAGLIKNGLLFGVLIGGVSGFLLYRKGKDQDARFSIYAGMLVLGVASGPLMLSITNRVLSGPPQPIEFDLISVKPVMGSRIGAIEGQQFKADAHMINMKKDGTSYQIKLGDDLGTYVMDDESIILNIREGGLGYSYVDHKPAGRIM